MLRNPFETIWGRIRDLEGREFETITHLPFTYSLESGTTVWVNREGRRINQSLAKSNFAQVYSYMQDGLISRPSEINEVAIERRESQVRGPYYVWAILHDGRVIR